MSAQSVVDKFEAYLDLGRIAVPLDYKHTTCIRGLAQRFKRGKLSIDKELTDENFSKASRVLHPQEQFNVYLFRQIPSGIGGVTTTTEERMLYLRRFENPVFLGAQGCAIVLEQKCELLPKSMTCVSMDEKDHLWSDSVSYSFPYANGEFLFAYLRQDYLWFPHHLFFGFFEVD